MLCIPYLIGSAIWVPTLLDIRGLPSPVGCACVEIDDTQKIETFSICYKEISFIFGKGLGQFG